MRTALLFLWYYGASAYGVINPLFGTLLFLHMLILRPEYLVWGNPVFGRVYLAAFACAAFGSLMGGRPTAEEIDARWSRRALWILAALVVWAGLVSLDAESSARVSLDRTVDLAKIWLLCWLISRTIVTRARIGAYVMVVAGSYGVLALWGIVQGTAGNRRLDDLAMGGSNYLAAQLVLVVPICVTMVLDNRRPLLHRIALLTGSLLIVSCLLYTGSRGGYVGLGIALSALTVMVGSRFLVRFVAIAIVSAVVVVPLSPDWVSERLGSILVTEEERDASAASRTALWQIAVEMWKAHPLTGVGLHNFPMAKEHLGVAFGALDSEVEDLIFGQQRMPHSLYFGLLAEAGAIGLALYCWFVGRAIWARAGPPGAAADEGLTLIARGARAGMLGFAGAALFGDFQYLELLYAQVMLIGAIHGAAAFSRSVDVNVGVGSDGASKPPVRSRQLHRLRPE